MSERVGLFVAMVGPSGAGKDALISGAARHPRLPAPVRFARRSVTRAATPGAEDHDSLDEAGFARAEADGAFALTWRAHGLRYGLPRSVSADLSGGSIVVGNVSRSVLGAAVVAFRRLRVVEVTALPETLLGRLTARGREDEQAVRSRLARWSPLSVPDAAEGHLRLDNSGDLDAAVELFVGHLDELCAGAQ